jgi:GT2 family glycosyltransferase
MVSSLRPGTYSRSGMSVPWGLIPATEEVVEGDWLPGGATMWKTETIHEVGFCEAFAGYAQGEDLDFSVRAGRKGKLVLAGAARLRHLHAASGRPNHFRQGYMALYNEYQIHRRVLEDRNLRDVAWFAYAHALDTLFLARHLLVPRRWGPTLRQLGGRLSAAYSLLVRR